MTELSIRTLRADEIECRVGQCGKSKNGVAWCSMLLYKDARCDQRILDELFTPFGWQRKHDVVNNQLCCTVSIKDNATGEWIAKQDVGTESNTEAVKGNFSDAFKRACFNWGIGRELYTAPKIFITLKDDEYSVDGGKVKLKPKTTFFVSKIDYDDKRNITELEILDGNGVVRFPTNGQKTSKKPAVDASQTRESDDSEISFNEAMEAYIKPALAQANDEAAVKRVWDSYPDYQKNNDFINVVTERLNQVK